MEDTTEPTLAAPWAPVPWRGGARVDGAPLWSLRAAFGRVSFRLGVLLLGAYVAAQGAEARAGASQLILFHEGTIHTGFLQGPTGAEPSRTVEALLVKDGRITAAGDFNTLGQSELGKSARRVGLRGGHAYPGFQDAHGSIEGLGRDLEEVDLRGSKSYEEVIRRVAAAAAELPAGEWVEGSGWDQTLWPDGAWPVHGPLTEAVPDHPVVLRRVDGRTVLVNGPALAAAPGLSKDPEGGRALRLDGKATGVLQGSAADLVLSLIPSPSPADRTRRMQRARERLLECGLTCVHDLDLDLEAAALLRALSSEEAAGLRIVGYVRADTWNSAADFRRIDAAQRLGDLFELRGCSLVLDGALGSRAAALLADYSDGKGERGMLFTDVERLSRQLRLAGEAGLQPAIHAIGDRANRLALNAIEQTSRTLDGFSRLRPRIEHAQVIESSDMQRFGELGVIPSMQPSHVASDLRWAQDRLGPERARGAYAWRSLLNLKNARPLALGSSFPAEDPSPLRGIHAALTRQALDGTPKSGWFAGQRLTATEALAGFTSGPAVAAGQDDRRGLLARGYFCDMTVLDVDLTLLTPSTAERALRAKVLMTIVNGRVLYGPK